MWTNADFEKGKRRVSLFCCFSGSKHKLPFQVQGTNCLFVCKHKLHFQVLIKNFLSVKCKLPFRCKSQITFQVQTQIAFSCANINYIFMYYQNFFRSKSQIVFSDAKHKFSFQVLSKIFSGVNHKLPFRVQT